MLKEILILLAVILVLTPLLVKVLSKLVTLIFADEFKNSHQKIK